VKIDLKVDCGGEIIKDAFENLDRSRVPYGHYMGVVGILQNWTCESGVNRVMSSPGSEGPLNKSLQNISHDNEEVRRHW
jgi:hypothetical protein